MTDAPDPQDPSTDGGAAPDPAAPPEPAPPEPAPPEPAPDVPPEPEAEVPPEPEPELAPEATMGSSGAERGVDSAILDAIAELQHGAMDPEAMLASAKSKAYQLVALNAALAVQDATDMLRNNTMIASTAAGVALGGLMATGEPTYELAIRAANKMMSDAIADYEAIGRAAARLLDGFPAGEEAGESASE